MLPEDDGDDDDKEDDNAAPPPAPTKNKTHRRATTERAALRLKPRLVARQRALLEACGWRAAILSWSRDLEPSLKALHGVRYGVGGSGGGAAGGGGQDDDKEEQEEVAWTLSSPLTAARRLVREEADAYARAHARMRAEEEEEDKEG